MTIKSKISLYISVFFSVLYAVIGLFIIYNFAEFREEEFEERLNEKAQHSIRMLADIDQIDTDLLHIIDKTSLNKLYDEKTLIFDDHFNLIYSSINDSAINWTLADLEYLRDHKSFFKMDGENEIYGVFYPGATQNYYALISAHDNHGMRKLNYLITLVVISYLIFVALTWIFTFYLVKQQLKPLDTFHAQISEINDLNVYEPLPGKSEGLNEIDLISKEFNHMMNRIADVYNQQRDFTAHASHELRTPLLRLSSQIEYHMLHATAGERAFLATILEDVAQLNELINSLLLLARTHQQSSKQEALIRIDEVLNSAMEKVHDNHPDMIIDFTIVDDEQIDTLLERQLSASLLEIAFTNLIRNAYLYSNNKKVIIRIAKQNHHLMIRFSNEGETLTPEEKEKLFQPFMRGANASESRGLGIGLTIVHRIISNYLFEISYEGENQHNAFTIVM